MDVLKLNTLSGCWTPLILVAAAIIVTVIVLILRSWGDRRYKKGSEQALPFLSGMGVVDPFSVRIRSDNLYWGFIQGLGPLFRGLKSFHSNDVNDIVIWGITLMALMFFVVLAGW
jgi:hypothetical protein